MPRMATSRHDRSPAWLARNVFNRIVVAFTASASASPGCVCCAGRRPHERAAEANAHQPASPRRQAPSRRASRPKPMDAQPSGGRARKPAAHDVSQASADRRSDGAALSGHVSFHPARPLAWTKELGVPLTAADACAAVRSLASSSVRFSSARSGDKSMSFENLPPQSKGPHAKPSNQQVTNESCNGARRGSG